MRSLSAFLRGQSLRVRITATFVATALFVTVAVSLTTFFAVQTFLQNSRIRSDERQTIFALLFARQFLATDPHGAERLVSLLQTRQGFQALVTTTDTFFSTSLALTPRVVPRGLVALASADRMGYQFMRVDRVRTLVFAAPLPPVGTNLYLLYSLDDVDRTLGLLARVLLLATVGATLVAGAAALQVSRRILRPLARVSQAARLVAEGLLETRVRSSSTDELGLLAASFNQMTAALQEMVQRERRFVAALSHELRTPLAALHATSEVLDAERADLPPAAREAVGLIREDIVDLRRLIEELMEISELDAKRATIRWEPVDLRALTQAVLRKRRRSVPLAGAALVTETDKGRVERIVGNLVDNAFEHGRGESVRITLDEREGWCEVRVQDEGPGIPPGDLPMVFERFYKADRSRSRERGGIGLGLALSMQNARLLGGTIEVSSEPGLGATFTLRLPRRTGSEEEP